MLSPLAAQRPSTIKTIVTEPPWARDEPPSPTTDQPVASSSSHFSSRQSNVSASTETPRQDWWTFNRKAYDPPRFDDKQSYHWPTLQPKTANRMRAMKERLMPNRQTSQDQQQLESGQIDPYDLHITIPSTPAPITLAHARTPGWDTPWSPRAPGQNRVNIASRKEQHTSPTDLGEQLSDDGHESRSRRKRFRMFILHHPAVPLLFRFINITFTTAALAIAIRIRKLETRYNVMGALGSSPTLVVIFAPLTLVHVMLAIYLEYFGRPLGLWRTSMKLAHTLSETLFICAWSAALSLCFDNLFTASIGCVPISTIAWYDPHPDPRTSPPLSLRAIDAICDHQVALICLVGVGLTMYCTNLIISLYRIFERVKYHSPIANNI